MEAHQPDNGAGGQLMRWFAIWLFRVIANALAGGLMFAFVGAFCGLIVGFMTGLGYLGSIVGAACGVVGVFIYLIGAASAAPGNFWRPFLELTPRVAFGQMGGTIIAITSFFAYEFVVSRFRYADFLTIVGEDMIFFCLFAPALMICGAIWKRDPNR